MPAGCKIAEAGTLTDMKLNDSGNASPPPEGFSTRAIHASNPPALRLALTSGLFFFDFRGSYNSFIL